MSDKCIRCGRVDADCREHYDGETYYTYECYEATIARRDKAVLVLAEQLAADGECPYKLYGFVPWHFKCYNGEGGNCGDVAGYIADCWREWAEAEADEVTP